MNRFPRPGDILVGAPKSPFIKEPWLIVKVSAAAHNPEQIQFLVVDLWEQDQTPWPWWMQTKDLDLFDLLVELPVEKDLP